MEKEIYFEHFGLLEDEKYLRNALDIRGIRKMLTELLGVVKDKTNTLCLK